MPCHEAVGLTRAKYEISVNLATPIIARIVGTLRIIEPTPGECATM